MEFVTFEKRAQKLILDYGTIEFITKGTIT